MYSIVLMKFLKNSGTTSEIRNARHTQKKIIQNEIMITSRFQLVSKRIFIWLLFISS